MGDGDGDGHDHIYLFRVHVLWRFASVLCVP